MRIQDTEIDGWFTTEIPLKYIGDHFRKTPISEGKKVKHIISDDFASLFWTTSSSIHDGQTIEAGFPLAYSPSLVLSESAIGPRDLGPQHRMKPETRLCDL